MPKNPKIAQVTFERNTKTKSLCVRRTSVDSAATGEVSISFGTFKASFQSTSARTAGASQTIRVRFQLPSEFSIGTALAAVASGLVAFLYTVTVSRIRVERQESEVMKVERRKNELAGIDEIVDLP